jgi:hypothetical protein
MKKRLPAYQRFPFNILLLAVLFISICAPGILHAQSDSLALDTTTTTVLKKKKGSIFDGKPGTSLLLSLAVPGAGQIYNKSYLRVPFVWAAVGTSGYFMIDNSRKYRITKDAFRARVDGIDWIPPENMPASLRGLENITDINRLKGIRDTYNEYRQQSIIIFSLVWLANGIDAFVNAHLKDFDIDDDLSLIIGPTSNGVGLVFNF